MEKLHSIPRRRKLATHGSHENTKEEEKKDLDHDGYKSVPQVRDDR